MTRARSGLPPLLSATTAAMSAGTPESVSHCTSSARGTGGNGDLDAPAGDGHQLGGDLVRQQHEDGVARRLLQRLEQDRRPVEHEVHVEDDDHLARRVQRTPLGQRDDLAHRLLRDRGAAAAHDVEVRDRCRRGRPGRWRTRRTRRRGRAARRRTRRPPPGPRSRRPAEEVGVHRVGRRGAQGRHRLVLRRRRRRRARGPGASALTGAAAGASPSRSRTDATICAVTAAHRRRAVDDDPVRGVRRGLGQEPLAHPRREVRPEALQAVGPPGPAASRARGHLDADVDQDREVRGQPLAWPTRPARPARRGRAPARSPGRRWSSRSSGR